MSRLIFVTNHDDWEGLYLDGKRVFQDHRVPLDIFAEYVLKAGEKPSFVSINPQQSYDLGEFPEDFSEVEIEGD